MKENKVIKQAKEKLQEICVECLAKTFYIILKIMKKTNL